MYFFNFWKISSRTLSADGSGTWNAVRKRKSSAGDRNWGGFSAFCTAGSYTKVCKATAEKSPKFLSLNQAHVFAVSQASLSSRPFWVPLQHTLKEKVCFFWILVLKPNNQFFCSIHHGRKAQRSRPKCPFPQGLAAFHQDVVQPATSQATSPQCSHRKGPSCGPTPDPAASSSGALSYRQIQHQGSSRSRIHHRRAKVGWHRSQVCTKYVYVVVFLCFVVLNIPLCFYFSHRYQGRLPSQEPICRVDPKKRCSTQTIPIEVSFDI